MKAFKVFIVIILIVSFITSTALAAEVESSIEYKDGPDLNSFVMEGTDTAVMEGTDTANRTVLLIPYSNIYLDDIVDEAALGIQYEIPEQMEASIRESLENAYSNLKNHPITELVTGFEAAWAEETDGAPLANAIVHDLFEAVLLCDEMDDSLTDESITISFTVDGIKPDDKFIIIHKPADIDKWIVEEHTIDANGVITMTVDKLSPFAIVKDSGKAVTSDVQSPATEFVPSIERKDSPELISFITDAACDTVLLIPYSNIFLDDIIDEDALDIPYEISEKMESAIRVSQKNAFEEMKNNPINELVTGFEDAWAGATGGAPLENAIVHDLFEIVLICTKEDIFLTDKRVTVSFTADGIKPDDKFIIVHKPTDTDKWIVEEHTIDANGVITMTVDKLSPFAIVKDSGKAPTSDVESPQTGVSDAGMIVTAVSALVMAAGAVIIGKKLRKTTVQ